MKSSNNLNRLFLFLFFIFSLLIGILLLRGDQTYPRVIETNLTSDILPLSTKQIVLTFNRNMDQASVEANFLVEPKVAGKFSWIGKKMAYSFTDGLEAGEGLKISLAGAKDEQGVVMEEPYLKNYETANQYLYFIGAQDDQKERLIQFDLNQKETKILSSKNLVLKDFKIHPDQNLVYLLGHISGSDQEHNDLYELNLISQKLEKIVDGAKEFIFSFDLSPDGKILLVRKGEINAFDQSSLIDPGILWTFDIPSKTWSAFWNKEIYGDEFYFSPDSKYLVGRLITGDITILSVNKNLEKTVYLENYAGSYALSPDGSKLAFVDFNDPFKPYDLLLRGKDGNTRELLKNEGRIQFPVFNRTGDKIYFLMSLPERDFKENGILMINSYHLYAYDLKEGKKRQITKDEAYFEGFFHVSSDGEKIAFERYKKGAYDGIKFTDQIPQAELWIHEERSGELKKLDLKGSKPFLN